MKLFLVASLLVAVALAEKVRYDGFEVLRVVPQTKEQVAALRLLSESGNGLSFWTEVAGENRPVDIMVPPHLSVMFKDFVTFQKLDAQVFMKDVQANVDQSQTRSTKAFDWTDYYRLDDMYGWLEELASLYPESVTVVNGGSTYEGRSIIGVKISFSSANENNAVFIEGGIHAREWISPAVVTYMVNELLTSSDARVRAIAESHDWYVFPSTNPDGYEYTHTTDRLWRKTRQPYSGCYGADPNRNWGFHWMDGGASSNPCSETFAGSAAFSEVETKTLSEYITTVQDKLVAYIGFHSYSQLLLIPYGHSSAHVENYDELYSIGLQAADSLASHYGTRYTVGNIVEVIYVASGGSMDWVKGTYGTRITYTYELRDTGAYGFLLPANQIIPSGEETLDSLLTILEEFAKK